MGKGIHLPTDASPILDLLKDKGIHAKIVGGVLEKGYSEHDLDLSVLVKSRFLYSKYVNAMRTLGYTRIAEPFVDHIEENLETWKKGSLVVDIWLEENEDERK